jgi:signal transduction histidine kinase
MRARSAVAQFRRPAWIKRTRWPACGAGAPDDAAGLVNEAISALAEATTERLPEPVEAAAYYAVAESLTNIARYTEAKSATGIRGLIDRLDALEGSLVVRSEAGRGTRIRARIPLEPARV